MQIYPVLPDGSFNVTDVEVALNTPTFAIGPSFLKINCPIKDAPVVYEERL